MKLIIIPRKIFKVCVSVKERGERFEYVDTCFVDYEEASEYVKIQNEKEGIDRYFNVSDIELR